ncbi:MAG: hypothetical protein R3F34_07025 [Planctomycetota bacterium]
MSATDAPTAARAPRIARLLDAAGWIGIALLLGAYAALEYGAVEDDSTLYLAANVAGAYAVATVCAWKRAWPALGLELAWIAITLVPAWSTR